jgi:hypothetical protein
MGTWNFFLASKALSFLRYFPYFEKLKWAYIAVCVYAPESISRAYSQIPSISNTNIKASGIS